MTLKLNDLLDLINPDRDTDEAISIILDCRNIIHTTISCELLVHLSELEVYSIEPGLSPDGKHCIRAWVHEEEK